MPTNLETAASLSEQLQRILASRTFRNTEVLKRLLEYLGRKAMAGEGDELKEYIVGVEAFGKSSDYDPKVDSAVRVQAGKLRHKLEEYYRTEGTGDPLVVELPKGCFALRFREAAPEAAPPSVVSPSFEKRGSRTSATPTVAWIALVVAVASLVYALALRRQSAPGPRYAHPAIAELWEPFVQGNRPVIVSLGAPLFARVAGRFVRNTRLNEWDAMERSGEAKLLEGVLKGKAAPVYIYTGIGEATGAFELGRLFLSFRKDLNLAPSSALTWEDIERHNVIFVGPTKYNRQAEHLPASKEFDMQPGRIVNLNPRENEPPYYGQIYAPDQNVVEGYALIARVPGLHGSGLIMLLASPSTEGSRAAVDYVTRPEYVTQLVASLKDSRGRIPPYFECVVQARFKSQTPIQIRQVALRMRGR